MANRSYCSGCECIFKIDYLEVQGIGQALGRCPVFFYDFLLKKWYVVIWINVMVPVTKINPMWCKAWVWMPNRLRIIPAINPKLTVMIRVLMMLFVGSLDGE
jgi:hypothetical protein